MSNITKPSAGAMRAARFGGNWLAGILVRHGIIDPCAVEDSEGYDAGLTMLRIRTAADEINAESGLRCAETEKQRDELAEVVRKVVCANRLEDHDLILADSALANLKRP